MVGEKQACEDWGERPSQGKEIGVLSTEGGRCVWNVVEEWEESKMKLEMEAEAGS